MFYIIIAVLAVLLIVWIGINAAYFRKHDASKVQQREPAKDEVSAPAPVESSTVSEPTEAAEPSGAVQETNREAQKPDIRAEVEVSVADTASPKTTGVFRDRDRPYVLHEVNVPLFTEQNWQTAFKQLTEDERVLGWVAFHEERLGAEDRSYEQDFIDALRQHRRATERLRRQAGLSHVTETAVVGDEGKVWFLTALDDAWFALFIERDEDGMSLAADLLAPVRAEETDRTLPTKA